MAEADWPRRIGIGTFRRIGAGENVTEGKRVEHKIAAFKGLTEADRKLIENDLKVLRDVDHDCLIRPINLSIDYSASVVQLIAECQPGMPLPLLLLEEPLLLTMVRHLSRQFLIGLQYMHESCLIHNALSCDNIFFNLIERRLILGLADPFARFKIALFSDDIESFGVFLLYVLSDGLTEIQRPTSRASLLWFDSVFQGNAPIEDHALKSLASSCLNPQSFGRPSIRKLLAHAWWNSKIDDDHVFSAWWDEENSDYQVALPNETCSKEDNDTRKPISVCARLDTIKKHQWQVLASKQELHGHLHLVLSSIVLLVSHIWDSERALLSDPAAIEKLQEVKICEIVDSLSLRGRAGDLRVVHGLILAHPEVFLDHGENHEMPRWQAIVMTPLAQWLTGCVEALRETTLRPWETCNWILVNDKAVFDFQEDQTLLVRTDDPPGHDRRRDGASVQRAIPLQPWEAEKLKSMATQVIRAMQDGRYVKDFGDMLLGQLQQWGENSDAEAWARREKAWVASLVDADDAESREALQKWLEDSLVSTLREVQKDVNRGLLSGSTGYPKKQDTLSLQETNDDVCVGGCSSDRQERAELDRAISESLMEFAELDENDFNDEDSDTDDEVDRIPCASHESTVLAEDVTSSTQVKFQNESTDCMESCQNRSHPCDMSNGCCDTHYRVPRPGLLPTLTSWWQNQFEMDTMPRGPFRFFCNTCSHRLTLSGRRIPLPFGGCLLEEKCHMDTWELVEPQVCLSDASSDSSWIDAGSDTLWIVVNSLDELE